MGLDEGAKWEDIEDEAEARGKKNKVFACAISHHLFISARSTITPEREFEEYGHLPARPAIDLNSTIYLLRLLKT